MCAYYSFKNWQSTTNAQLRIHSKSCLIYLTAIIITVIVFNTSFVALTTATTPTAISTLLAIGSSDETNTPTPLWNYTTDSRVGTYDTRAGMVYTSPIIVQGILYFASDEGYVYALNAASGTKIWSTYKEGHLPHTGASKFPIVYDNKIFLNGYREMYALDAKSGAIIWETIVSPGTTNKVMAPPVVANGTLYIGYERSFYALDSFTGDILWIYGAADVAPSPLVVGDVVYAGSSNKVFALDAQDIRGDREIWTYTVGSKNIDRESCVSSFVFGDGVLYFCAGDGNAYALEADSGQKIWSYTYTSRLPRHYISSSSFLIDPSAPSAPILRDGLIYMGSNTGEVYALNASDGTKLWNSTIGAGRLSAPALYSDVLYVGSSDGNLYALNATNGFELWTYPVSSPISWDYSSWGVGGGVGSPLVCDGVLYVGGGDGVYALEVSLPIDQPPGVSPPSVQSPLTPISLIFVILIIMGAIAIVTVCWLRSVSVKNTERQSCSR